MATTQELTNLAACGLGNALGTNTKFGCPFDFGSVSIMGLIRPSAKFVAGSAFNLAAVTALQKSGDVVLLKGVTTFAETGNDDAIETLEDDTQILTNKGKHKFLATFAQDLYFQKALSSLEGHARWSVFFIDVKGNILMTSDISGNAIGFTAGMARAGKMQFATSTTGLKNTFEIQLLDRAELDDNFAYLDSDQLDFDPRQLEPVIQAELGFASIPGAADVALSVRVVSSRGKQPIPGLSVGDFTMLKNGVASNPTTAVYDANTGLYTLAVVAVAVASVLELSLNSTVEVVGDGLYKAQPTTITVVV
jgi:hypothetical protein